MIQELNPNMYQTMTEIASSTIKEAILKRVYKPGTRLIPGKLEKKLNLGRVSIREALRELSGSGLVFSIPNKGSIVAYPPKIEEINEIFEIRYILEAKAAQIATPKISMKTIQKLEDLHKRMCNSTTPHKDYFFLNKEFHTNIYQASGWNYLCQIIIQLIEQVHTFRSRYLFRSEDFYSFNKDHEQILQAIRERKPKKVKELILANVRNGFETLATVYRQKEKPNKF